MAALSAGMKRIATVVMIKPDLPTRHTESAKLLTHFLASTLSYFVQANN
jgi:hypothetical protein